MRSPPLGVDKLSGVSMNGRFQTHLILTCTEQLQSPVFPVFHDGTHKLQGRSTRMLALTVQSGNQQVHVDTSESHPLSTREVCS